MMGDDMNEFKFVALDGVVMGAVMTTFGTVIKLFGYRTSRAHHSSKSKAENERFFIVFSTTKRNVWTENFEK